MNPKLHSNKELNDYNVNDSFNFLTKAEAIKIFLEQNSASLEANKMIVLYGDWGSGKTSLMRHIESTIEPIIYKPIFFQAWEHEKDENLALSLCDALTGSLQDKTSKLVKDFMKGALLTLKSFASGVTFKSSSLLSGLGIDLEISGEKIVKEINEAIDNSKHPSFYSTNNAFKEKFIEVENTLLKEANAQKLLIFIDDLDRCEPENVLNLITALKLFFTYGKSSVFFCGIDKEAVTKAVKTKYKDVIKSEEYMEKVFDIAFNMPKTFSLRRLIENYFPGETELQNGKNTANVEIIEDFLKSIGFCNPRHLKKVLNKYEILKSFKVLATIPQNLRELIPNIIESENNGEVFETIYTLLIIILYEFSPTEFMDVKNYRYKMAKYTKVLYDTKSPVTSNYSLDSAAMDMNSYLIIEDEKKQTINSILNPQSSAINFIKFIYIFSNSRPSSITIMYDDELNLYEQNFIDDNISTKFCLFLIEQYNSIMKVNSKSNYKIFNLFEMAEYLL